MRSVILLCLGLAFFAHTSAYALGLGEMTTRSTIGEPLDADIALLSVDNAELNTIKITLADIEDFQSAGVERLPVLNRLKFRVMRDPSGKPVIRIHTNSPINEPFLNFLLEVDWSNGRLLREYTALLDPPTTTERKPPKIESPGGQIKLTPTQTTPPAVGAGRTPARTDEYGPVKAKETLWSIANRVRPDNVTMQQMMVAIQRANPQAFIGGNINRLRKGQILRVPDLQEILKISPAQAATLFRRQMDAWLAQKNTHAPAKPNAAAPQAAGASAQQKQPSATHDSAPDAAQNAPGANQQAPDRLQIATARPEGEGSAGASEGRGDVQTDYELNQQLLRARENAETARQEANILRSEIDGLQTRLSNMQRLLTLKDEQLAQLQDRVGQHHGQTNAPDQQRDEQISPPDDDQALIHQGTVVDAAQLDPAVPIDAAMSEQNGAGNQPDDQPAPYQKWWVETKTTAANLWRKISTEPFYLAGLGGILLMLLVFLVVRRKRNEQAAEEMALQDPFDAGYVPAPTATDEPDDDDNDPVNQADRHIAYGRFQEAEDLLKQAQQTAPQRFDIQHKLLELYHATHNAQAFNKVAQQLLNNNQHKHNANAWDHILAMGAELDPDNPLYQPNTSPPKAASKSDNNQVDFTLDESHTAPPRQPAATRQSNTPPTLAALDQPLDIEHAFQSVVNENSHAPQTSSQPFELESNEVKNKLDLARVYIDMGDTEGALDILQEVQQEGSQRQKNQASELMAKIS